MTLAERLAKRIRQIRGPLPTWEVAHRAKMAESQWSRIERFGPKTLATLEKVCKGLGCEPRRLFDGAQVEVQGLGAHEASVGGDEQAPVERPEAAADAVEDKAARLARARKALTAFEQGDGVTALHETLILPEERCDNCKTEGCPQKGKPQKRPKRCEEYER